jgi:hypothetical protein
MHPVSIRGIQVGEPVDVFFDSELRCVLGLEVRCRDGIHRFLPWSVGETGPDGVSISFSLALLDRPQLEYYREHAIPLSRLRRLPVERTDATLPIEDVVTGAGGRIVALVVGDGGSELEIARDDVTVDGERLCYVDDRPAEPLAQAFGALLDGG